MIVCDANVSLTLTGTGDVLEPVDGVIGIGSGGMYATAAARALLDVPGMDAEQIGRKRIERRRFFSLSVHCHVFGTGAAREFSDGARFAAEFVTKSLARE